VLQEEGLLFGCIFYTVRLSPRKKYSIFEGFTYEYAVFTKRNYYQLRVVVGKKSDGK